MEGSCNLFISFSCISHKVEGKIFEFLDNTSIQQRQYIVVHVENARISMNSYSL